MAPSNTKKTCSGGPGGSDTPPLGASDVARLSDAEIVALAKEAIALRSRQDCLLALLGGELERRQGFRASGASSLVAWFEAELGVSPASARSYGALGEVLIDLPHVAEALSSGAVSLDKAKVVAAVATPEDEAQWAASARELSVRDLGALVRSKSRPGATGDRVEHEGRFVRLDDARRSLVGRFAADAYAQVKGALLARTKALGSDGETALDQRMADALVSLLEGRGGGGPGGTVVAHVPFEVLQDPLSDVVGEIEGLGLVSAEVARRLACGAEVIVALDDEVGHTMYEGRAQRLATATQRREVRRRDRHCVFPGCAHVHFADAHHIAAWEDGGTTDLHNLALLCRYHHHLVHSNEWSMWGDANVEVFFRGPDGQVRSTSPSPLWAQVTDPGRLAEQRRALTGSRPAAEASGDVSGSNGMDPGG